MRARSKSRLIWAAALLVLIAAFLWFSEGAMTWLRLTLHGR